MTNVITWYGIFITVVKWPYFVWSGFAEHIPKPKGLIASSSYDCFTVRGDSLHSNNYTLVILTTTAITDWQDTQYITLHYIELHYIALQHITA